MAIVIPSAKTYERKNPKVRDNVVERIEVSSNLINFVNEENVLVYSKKLNIKEIENITIEPRVGNFEWFDYNAMDIYFAYVGFLDCKKIDINISIPRVSNNKFITDIQYYLNENQEPEIKQTIQGYKKVGNVTAKYFYSDNGQSITAMETKELTYIETSSKQQPYNIPKTEEFTYIYDKLPNTDLTITSTINFGENGTIGTVRPTITENTISFSFSCYVGFKIVKYGDDFYRTGASSEKETTGIYEEYEPTQVEFSFYGNTIGVDLTDQTVYINGQTAKKVYSVDGNELMQTDNYILDENGDITDNAIEVMYGETQKSYGNGKETVTLRCSISDYYEADKDGFPTDNKVISIDNSMGKMTFEMYDQVIPMVYGANGKDRPISYYKDGTPKVFEVLGTKIPNNGAIFQEIYAQELDK